MSIIEKSLTYFIAVDKEINPVLKTVSFTRSKGITVGKYSIELTEISEEKTSMHISCVGSSNGGESNAHLETFLTEYLNIFTATYSGKSDEEILEVVKENNSGSTLGWILFAAVIFLILFILLT
jgi:hypothetical protein